MSCLENNSLSILSFGISQITIEAPARVIVVPGSFLILLASVERDYGNRNQLRVRMKQ